MILEIAVLQAWCAYQQISEEMCNLKCIPIFQETFLRVFYVSFMFSTIVEDYHF